MKSVQKQTLDKVAPESPYRGIHPFRFIDQKYYFGREELTSEIVDKVLLYRLVVLFGESGSGKSSLLNAGLVPALKRKGYQPERLRVRPFSDQPFLIERIKAGADQETLLPSIFESVGDESTCSVENFHTAINHAVQSQDPVQYPVLIFDQFEELFTLFGQGGLLQSNLLNTIARLAADVRLRVKIILSIREDFLGKLQLLTERYPQVFDHRVRIDLLTKENAKQSILCPFQEPNPFVTSLTSDLADRIILELGETQANRSIPPTQLQIVCRRLWDTYASTTSEISVPQFEAMGGVKGIVKEFLASELQLFESSLRQPAVEILTKLITDSNTRDVVSREKIGKLAGLNGKQGGRLSTILETLEKRRLINQESQRGTYYFELSSEFLIEPVQKEFARRKHERQRLWARIVVLGLIGLLIGGGIFSYQKYTKAEKKTETLALQVEQAEVRVRQEEKISDGYVRLFENLKKLEKAETRAEAKSGILAQAQQGEVAEAWIPLIESIVRNNQTSPAEAKEYAAELEKSAKKSPAPNPDDEAARLPIRIYMQIPNPEQIDTANQIKKKLVAGGIAVPRIQVVNSSSKNNVLKYFKKEEDDNGNVKNIADLLKSFGMEVKVSYIKGYENSTVIRPKHYELLFAGSPPPAPTTPVQNEWFVVVDFDPRYINVFGRDLAGTCVNQIATRVPVMFTRFSFSHFEMGPFERQENAQRARELLETDCIANPRAVLEERPKSSEVPVR